MRSFDSFILARFAHQYKVRWTTLYHLLKGKRTTSILLYGAFYGQLPYVAVFPKLTIAEVEMSIDHLVQAGFLIRENDFVQITAAGYKWLENTLSVQEKWQTLNGFRYSRIATPFKDQLFFATQVISELAHQQQDYLPLENQYLRQMQLKQWLSPLLKQKERLIAEFYQEWQNFLKALPAESANRWAKRLTGYQQTGFTLTQMSQQEQLAGWKLSLIEQAELHELLRQLEEKSEAFPLFKSLLTSLGITKENQSAATSYQLFIQGKTIEQIAVIRKLKPSTIAEHLIESCLFYPDFPYERVFSQTEWNHLKAYQKQKPDIRTWNYQALKDQLPMISYPKMCLFQLFVLNKGEKHEGFIH